MVLIRDDDTVVVPDVVPPGTIEDEDEEATIYCTLSVKI
jgi:hypothetical protein